ncbi:MAG: hypothetical protein Kow0077_20860 [Anaerolineae bacterium]
MYKYCILYMYIIWLLIAGRPVAHVGYRVDEDDGYEIAEGSTLDDYAWSGDERPDGGSGC